jgi:hypothetical protein
LGLDPKRELILQELPRGNKQYNAASECVIL